MKKEPHALVQAASIPFRIALCLTLATIEPVVIEIGLARDVVRLPRWWPWRR